VEFLADDGAKREQLDAALRKARHAPLDDFSHAGGDTDADLGAVEGTIRV
jgi:hypothetical protein